MYSANTGASIYPNAGPAFPAWSSQPPPNPRPVMLSPQLFVVPSTELKSALTLSMLKPDLDLSDWLEEEQCTKIKISEHYSRSRSTQEAEEQHHRKLRREVRLMKLAQGEQTHGFQTPSIVMALAHAAREALLAEMELLRMQLIDHLFKFDILRRTRDQVQRGVAQAEGQIAELWTTFLLSGIRERDVQYVETSETIPFFARNRYLDFKVGEVDRDWETASEGSEESDSVMDREDES